MGDTCWYCGGKLYWQSDFNYDEVFGKGEGIVTYLKCSHCGANVEYSKCEDNDENGTDFFPGEDN